MKLLKSFVVLIVVTLFLGACSQETAGEKISKETRKWPFYKLEKNGKTMYVLGTIHIGNAKMNPIPEVIRNAAQDADAYASELGNTQATGADLSDFQYENSIESKLTKQSKAKLKQIAKDFGIKYENMTKLKNIGLMSTQYGSPISLALGIESQIEEDDLAFSDDKKDTSLDGGNVRDKFYDEINRIDPNEYIAELQSLAEVTKQGEVLLEDYHKGKDLSKYIVTENMSEKEKKLEYALLDYRNKAWVPKLEELAKTNDTSFVYVGAYHLIGENGILALMEKKGYTVSAVALNKPLK
ncbi:MAG: TraB/GumN family protein [Bacilli bacterium]